MVVWLWDVWHDRDVWGECENQGVVMTVTAVNEGNVYAGGGEHESV